MCVTTEDFKEFIGDGKYEGLVLNTKLQRLVALKLFFLMKTFHLLTIMKIIAELNVKIISYDKSKLKIFIVKSVKKKNRNKKKMKFTEVPNIEVKEEKKNGIFTKIIKKVFSKEDGEFTAERAWLETTYGEGCNMSLEERIESKQREIISLIKSKFPARNSDMVVCYRKHTSYRCVIDIEEDLVQHTEEVLKPFVDNGFKIIDLSEKVDEIEDEHVYLISWKNIFKKS